MTVATCASGAAKFLRKFSKKKMSVGTCASGAVVKIMDLRVPFF